MCPVGYWVFEKRMVTVFGFWFAYKVRLWNKLNVRFSLFAYLELAFGLSGLDHGVEKWRSNFELLF